MSEEKKYKVHFGGYSFGEEYVNIKKSDLGDILNILFNVYCEFDPITPEHQELIFKIKDTLMVYVFNEEEDKDA